MKAVDSVVFPENASRGTVWSLCCQAVREMKPTQDRRIK